LNPVPEANHYCHHSRPHDQGIAQQQDSTDHDWIKPLPIKCIPNGSPKKRPIHPTTHIRMGMDNPKLVTPHPDLRTDEKVIQRMDLTFEKEIRKKREIINPKRDDTQAQNPI
jgi:hypothetical protein